MSRIATIVILGSTQTLAWASSYYLPAVLADAIAHDTGVSTNWLFGIFSAALVISALLGPRMGRMSDAGGGNRMLAGSNLLFTIGLVLLAFAHSMPMLAASWLVLGVGMGFGLYDAAFAVLGRIYGANARGAITGITARGRDGYLVTLSAPAVILACGGWQNNKALMAQYLGPRAADMPLIAPGVAYNTGDGLRMATAVGGGVAGQFDMVHGEPYDTRTTHPDAVVLSYPYGILVNKHAKRFLDEGVEPLDMTFEAFSYEIWRNQDNEAYLIGDQSMVEVPYFELLNTTDKDPETADTLGELASKLGLDPASLEATVAEFNAACPDTPFDPTTKDGKATQGIEPPKTNWAHPLERGPFVGWPLTSAVCFVFGGVRTDAQARVVSPSGAPIPGLYAAGELTGVFYHYYPVGTSVLRGLTFGRLAGAHAAQAAREVAAV